MMLSPLRDGGRRSLGWPIGRAPLEDWLRDRYFEARIDLSGSGVQNWSLLDLRERLEISHGELDAVMFDDSPSLGRIDLREAIAQRWGNGDPSRIAVAHGSTDALFLILTTLLRAGDEVIVVRPYYHALRDVAATLGCTIKQWVLRPQDGFRPDLDRLRSLVTSSTRLVVVNYPNNPTGATLSFDEQRELVSIVEKAGSYLVWDSAFSDLTYHDDPRKDLSEWYERCVSVGTLSKAYGLPGLRFGWCIAPPEVLDAVIPLRDRLTLSLSPLTELIALRVVQKAEVLLRPRIQQALRNLAMVRKWATSVPEIQWIEPLGGVTAFPRLLVEEDVVTFCAQLEQSSGVLLVPGACFGHPEHVRLGFGGPTEHLRVGLSIVGEALTRRGAGALAR